MSVVLSKCAECKHFLTKTYDDGLICDAFPEGIPEDWFWKGNPEKGATCNNGFSFEQDVSEK